MRRNQGIDSWTASRLTYLKCKLRTVHFRVLHYRFRGSANYWESRYYRGGRSGDGSCGELAQYKARFVNHYVAVNHVSSVAELGCGDGGQLNLSAYPRYLGIDVSPTAIKICADRFSGDPTKSFLAIQPNGLFDRSRFITADVVLSLDVLYHLVEDDAFQGYMFALFGMALRSVIIYSSDTDDNTAIRLPHVRNRHFSEWVRHNIDGWQLVCHEANPYAKVSERSVGSIANFFVYERRERT